MQTLHCEIICLSLALFNHHVLHYILVAFWLKYWWSILGVQRHPGTFHPVASTGNSWRNPAARVGEAPSISRKSFLILVLYFYGPLLHMWSMCLGPFQSFKQNWYPAYLFIYLLAVFWIFTLMSQYFRNNHEWFGNSSRYLILNLRKPWSVSMNVYCVLAGKEPRPWHFNRPARKDLDFQDVPLPGWGVRYIPEEIFIVS